MEEAGIKKSLTTGSRLRLGGGNGLGRGLHVGVRLTAGYNNNGVSRRTSEDRVRNSTGPDDGYGTDEDLFGCKEIGNRCLN